jgi:DNA-binding NarL/FixJ family response regulator
MTDTPISVVLVDDQALVRDGFAMIVGSQPDMVVVGSAEDGAEAIGLVRREQPDVVLMDVRMPGVDGLAATRALLSSGTRSKVIMLTTFDLDEYVAEALALGASGFLLKDSPRSVLLTAIRRAAADELVLAPSVLDRMVSSFLQHGIRTPDPRLDDLTVREREVLALLAEGLSNAEIADRLCLGLTTVKTYVGRLLDKTGLRDRVQLVVLAHECGLTVPSRTQPDGR